jgi:hypothetical protein
MLSVWPTKIPKSDLWSANSHPRLLSLVESILGKRPPSEVNLLSRILKWQGRAGEVANCFDEEAGRPSIPIELIDWRFPVKWTPNVGPWIAGVKV